MWSVSNWPVVLSSPSESDIVSRNLSSTDLTDAFFAAGSAPTWGSWVEVVTSTPTAMVGAVIYTACQPDYRWEVRFGVGASGSEVPVYEGIPIVNNTATGGMVLPVAFPKGVRVAVSFRTTGGFYGRVGVRLLASASNLAPTPYATITPGGVSSCQGVTIDPGGTSNTWSSWTDIVASTTGPTKALQFFVAPKLAYIYTNRRIWCEFGVGSTPVKIGELHAQMNAVQWCLPGWSEVYPVDIPPGTAIKMRVQVSANGSDERIVVGHCLRFA